MNGETLMEMTYVENAPCAEQKKGKLSLLGDILVASLVLLRMAHLVANIC